MARRRASPLTVRRPLCCSKPGLISDDRTARNVAVGPRSSEPGASGPTPLDDTAANGPDRQARRKERSSAPPTPPSPHRCSGPRRRHRDHRGVRWFGTKGEVAGSNPPGAPVQITMTSGQSTSSLNNALAAKGVIGSALALRIYNEIHGTPSVVPGRYLLHQHLSFAALRAALAPGPEYLSAHCDCRASP